MDKYEDNRYRDDEGEAIYDPYEQHAHDDEKDDVAAPPRAIPTPKKRRLVKLKDAGDEVSQSKKNKKRQRSDKIQEEDDFLKFGSKRKRKEDNIDIGMKVEKFLAKMEVAAEEDAELNRQGEPAVMKLKMVGEVRDFLSSKHLQQELLDRGVLCVLKTWLEPLPDGSLPNVNFRSAVLNIVNNLGIDISQPQVNEQLKKSRLAMVVKFLSLSDEETAANRHLANHVVAQWNRVIFRKSTRFEDIAAPANYSDVLGDPFSGGEGSKRVHRREEEDVDLSSNVQVKAQSGAGSRVSRPHPLPLCFTIRPESKIDPHEVRARAQQAARVRERRTILEKKLKRMSSSKTRKLRLHKFTVSTLGLCCSAYHFYYLILKLNMPMTPLLFIKHA